LYGKVEQRVAVFLIEEEPRGLECGVEREQFFKRDPTRVGQRNWRIAYDQQHCE